MSDIGCILYPPTLDYHYLVQRPQHLMKNFSLQDISCMFMNLPGVFQRDFRGIEEINPQLFVFHEIDPVPYLNGIRPVVYYSATAQVDKVSRYNPALLVFDSVDEPSDEFAAWRPYYHRAVASADVVLCTSEKLYHMARAINSHVYLVPNGCDYDHFSRAARGELARPYELKHMEGPIIGYIGVIATWCDLELIDRLARAYPHCQLVMVGPLYNVGRVPQRPNLHWLGFKAYDQLPAYAQAFDVGIIPFRQTNMTESVNPIKMWEYMAAGLPVVSTALPEASKYRELIHYSLDQDDFIENVGQALAHDTEEKRMRRLTLARENSWAARAREVVRIMEYHLAKKEPDYESLNQRPRLVPFREMVAWPDGQPSRDTLITSSRPPRRRPVAPPEPAPHNNQLERQVKAGRTSRHLVNTPNSPENLVAVPDAFSAYRKRAGAGDLRFHKAGLYIKSRLREAEELEPWMLE